jgi:hypothetical protein
MWQAIERLMPRKRRLERSIRRIRHKYAPLVYDAEARSASQELLDLVYKFDEEVRPLRHENRLLETEYWINRAYHYRIPLPPFKNEYWERDPGFLGDGLTIAGINELQTSIHEEQKRRRDSWHAWAGLFTQMALAATGVIGALTALFSVWHHSAGK